MNLKIFNKQNRVVAGNTDDSPQPPPSKEIKPKSPATPIDTTLSDLETEITALASPSRRDRVKTMGQKNMDAGEG